MSTFNHPGKPDTGPIQHLVKEYRDTLQQRYAEIDVKAEEDFTTTDQEELDVLEVKLNYAQSLLNAITDLE